MKVRDTSQGRMYAVSSEIGCTAINGAMAVDIPAGGQSVILALDKKIVIDGDDDAKFVEVRWGTNTAVGSRPVPPWISDVLAGLISITGDDNFDFNYIPAENKLVVHTDRVDDTQYAEVTGMLERVVPKNIEVEYYNHNMEISWKDINKYAECETYADMVAVNPDFANDLTSDGEWCYRVPKLKYLNRFHEGDGAWNLGFWRDNKNIKKWSVELPAVTYAGSGFASSSIEVFDGGFPALVCPTYQFWAGEMESQGSRIFDNAKNLRFFRGDLSHARRLVIAFSGCSNLTEFHSTLESLCMADGAFYGCQLDKPSALRILNSLPTKEYVDSVYTNLVVSRQKITIGIHIDHQNDEEVLTAISNAEANGWKLTVQWNPGGPTYTTPEASTFAMGTIIYAKVDEIELPDGTTEQYLDWGHYVTNWEEQGYEQFRSLESAYEYFGLEMPEVETEE